MLKDGSPAEARDGIYVNLQPDQRGPTERNTHMLLDVETGHNRAPPSQRMADPTRLPSSTPTEQLAPQEFATEGRKFYASVIDKQTVAELRLPKKSGCSSSYKCAALQALQTFQLRDSHHNLAANTRLKIRPLRIHTGSGMVGISVQFHLPTACHSHVDASGRDRSGVEISIGG